ncbi:MAG: ABC transporter permease [Bacilli bacterium]
MKQWFVLYRKEMLEMWRNYKLVWVPLVFMLLGVMQPISTYYLPQILDKVGGLPEGAVIEIPLPTSSVVLMEVLSNYGLLGMLILVLSAMGVVSTEKQSGVAGLVMVKPVSHFHYISAKWAGLTTITLLSLLIGYAVSWYYTDLLIGGIEFNQVWQSALIYSLWLIVCVTITLLMSTLLRGNGGIAFISIIIITCLSIITNLFTQYMSWSPANLSNHASSVLLSGEVQSNFLLTVLTTVGIIAAMIVIASLTSKNDYWIQQIVNEVISNI